MRNTLLMPTILTAVIALTACSSAPKKADETAAGTPSTATAPASTPAASQAVSTPAYDPLRDPNHALAKRSVFFDFDDFQVKEQYNAVVSAHANYLSKNQGRQIVIEGHADERGSSEYNLALGQKRAEAVRRALEVSGVSGKQMEAVSLGEEKPRAQGSNEAAWAENRRADIVYK